MENVVSIKNLNVSFDTTKALDGVSIQLKPGRVIGFIGPSGAGKTTLIRTIVGRHQPDSGTVLVLGAPAGSVSLRSRLSYMTQENSVYPDLSVMQNLTYFATMRGLNKSASRSTIKQLLELMDMSNQARQLVASLSGGQKQRVSLAI